MADFYKDTDTGSDANNGTTWALAKLTREGLLAVMSAGDRGYEQGAAADNSTSSRTLSSPGTITNPILLTGVADGTTNEPPLLADLAVTLPVISVTGTDPDMTFTGSSVFINFQFIFSDRGSFAEFTSNLLVGCKYSITDLNQILGSSYVSFVNTDIESLSSSGNIQVALGANLEILGGTYLPTVVASFFRVGTDGIINIKGFDISGLGTTNLFQGTAVGAQVRMSNCKIPTIFNFFSGIPVELTNSVELISCSDTTSQAATSSIQDYIYQDPYGSINAEFTVIRTGGADDGASGAFAHAMTPHANATLESSSATLKSPWMPVWIEAGSQTLTVFIANSSASTDYNENEVWVEFYTPDSADTAQHEQNFDPSNARLFASSTAITDDTSSTWGAGGNNHQKLSVAVTPGFEGPAYARLHLAKRQATPDTLYLDPVIEIS